MSYSTDTIRGPFYPDFDGRRYRLLSDGGQPTNTVKRKMLRRAQRLGIRITFECKPYGSMISIAVLTDNVDPRRMPKKHQRRSFAARANCVMSLAGTAHNVPDVQPAVAAA